MAKYDVLGIGNALMDTLFEVDDKAIDDLALKKGAIIFHDESGMMNVLSYLAGLSPKRSPGGSVANTISGLANMGSRVAFCGMVGNDDDGAFYVRAMAESGITVLLSRSEGMTGRVLALVTPDAERTFAVNLGVNPQFTMNQISFDDIRQSRFLHLEGYGVYDERTRPAILGAMKYAKEHGVKVSFDLSDCGLVRQNVELLQEVVPRYVDVIFANEEEALAFTGLLPGPALHELGKMASIAVVKVGKHGSMIKSNGKVYHVGCEAVTALDTTGAGDMYAAGFLYGLSRNLPLDKAGKIGSFAAGMVVSQMGARLEHPIKDDVERLSRQ